METVGSVVAKVADTGTQSSEWSDTIEGTSPTPASTEYHGKEGSI